MIIAVLKANVMRNIESDQTTADYQLPEGGSKADNGGRPGFYCGIQDLCRFASSFGVMLGCVRPGIYVVNGSRPLVDSLVDLTKMIR